MIPKFPKSKYNLDISENLKLKRETKYFIVLAHGSYLKVVTFFSIHSLAVFDTLFPLKKIYSQVASHTMNQKYERNSINFVMKFQ